MGCSPQAPLFMGFPRQEYWSGLPFPSPGDLLNPGIEPTFPALAGRFFTAEPPGKPNHYDSLPFILKGAPPENKLYGHPNIKDLDLVDNRSLSLLSSQLNFSWSFSDTPDVTRAVIFLFFSSHSSWPLCRFGEKRTDPKFPVLCKCVVSHWQSLNVLYLACNICFLMNSSFHFWVFLQWLFGPHLLFKMRFPQGLSLSLRSKSMLDPTQWYITIYLSNFTRGLHKEI